jgi:triacylglycerol lipase
MRRLTGLLNLIHDVIEKTTDLVEETHESVMRKPVDLLSAIEPIGDTVRVIDGARRFTTSVIYSAIRATNHGARLLSDAGIALATAAASERDLDVVAGEERSDPVSAGEPSLAELSPWVDHAQAALNAAFGDFLHERGNALEIEMSFCHNGLPLPLTAAALARAQTAPTGKVCLFVHGLGWTERAWNVSAKDADAAVDFGALLSRELGYTPFYLRYNSGLHISEYPVAVEEFVLVGHSMGGLVVRSAAHYGALSSASWVRRLTHVFCLGSPHLGAPLEKAGNILASALSYFDTAGTQVPAKILNARSSGIKDLRYGYIIDEDWSGKEPDAFLEDNRRDIPFVDSALYCFIGSTVTVDPNHPLGQLIGDVLVRLPSAAGFAPKPARGVPFHFGRVVGGAGHLELVTHREVYGQIRKWLSERPDFAAPVPLRA